MNNNQKIVVSDRGPQVSVVITCYNYGSYLDTSLSSVLQQSVADFEIIIIDDGSSDNTAEIVKPYLQDPRIRYIFQENAGQPKAKNRGILESRGDFVAFLDADDVWMPRKLEKQLALFSDTQVGVVYSRRLWINPDGDETQGNERTLHRGRILNQMFVDNFICFSSSVVRRTLLLEVGAFDENLPMGIDYDLWIRLAAICDFDYVDEPLVKYRTGHANLSRNTLRRYDCAEKIMRKSLDDPKIREKLAWYVPRLAWADTWSNKAVYLAAAGRFKESFYHLFKAALEQPLYLNLWKRVLRVLLMRLRQGKA